MNAERTAIIVLGCPPVLRDGRPNPFFLGRVEATLALHRSRPTDPILCSGTTDRSGRDEATWLVEALRRRGVDDAVLARDDGSARTRDSVDEAARRYPDRALTFVSQPFHLPRVLGLAARRGLDAHGVTAPGPRPSRRLIVREWLARLRARLEG